jgi:hypothetical protein
MALQLHNKKKNDFSSSLPPNEGIFRDVVLRKIFAKALEKLKT